MQRWFLVGALIGVFVPIVGGGLTFQLWQRSNVLAFGIHVQGVNIGGTKPDQARQILERVFNSETFSRITAGVFWKERAIKRVRLSELGVKPDIEKAVKEALQIGRRKSFRESLVEFVRAWQGGVHLPMPCRLDEKTAAQILKQIAKSLNRPVRQALVELVGDKVHIIPSNNGLVVKVDETLNLWRERLSRGQWETLPLIVFEVKPEVSTEDVASIDSIIGRATTTFRTSDRNRTHNIRLAAARLDRVLIRPKETISFNEIVGPRTPKRGFKMARILVRGQFTEDFGGGVCQVSGTLYLAALRAGMEIVQRHRHSRPVEYLPPGLDVTVNFGSLDLKIRNPYDAPIYLRTFVKGGRLTVLVLGKREKGVIYKIVRTVEKFGTSEVKPIPDQNSSQGMTKVTDKGSKGYRVTIWRLRVENGIVTKRERISSDIYLPRPKVVRIGMQRATLDTISSQTPQTSQNPQTSLVTEIGNGQRLQEQMQQGNEQKLP